MRPGRVLGVALGMCLAASACEQSGVTAPLGTTQSSVSIIAPSDTLLLGDEIQLRAVANPETGQPFSWQTSDSGVAPISAGGIIRADRAGATTISATSAARVGTRTFTISNAVSRVVLSPDSTSLTLGASTAFSFKAYNAHGHEVTDFTGATFSWTSTAPDYVSADPNGYATAKQLGSARLILSIDGAADTSVVEVVATPVASVAVSPTSVSLTAGQTAQLTATARDASGNVLTDRVPTWTSNDTNVAVVSSSGVVTGKATGSATVSATVEGKVASASISVAPAPVASVTVTLNASSLTVGQSTQAAAVAKDANGNVLSGLTVTWSASAPTIASVTSQGTVTALAAGTSNIVATVGGKSGSATETVAAPVQTPASVQITAPTTSITTGNTLQLGATVKDSAGQTMTGASVSWSSGNTSVATVSSSGMVTGVAAGTATITATSGSAKGTFTLSVTNPVTSGGTPSTAELPRVLLNSSYPTQTGNTIAVPAGGDLQGAIDAAQPGDVITLAPGATYTGNFILRNKNTSSTSWIVIRPATSLSLPAEGTRMSPSLATTLLLPKIVSPTTAPAFATELGAHHYRLTGLEVTVDPSQTLNYGTIALGTDGPGGQTTTASIAHDFVLDRMYIHGNSTVNLRRCVSLNSASTAIVDSYLADAHDSGQDAQAIGGWNGPGPYKIVNNHLEASGEVILFGGSDPGVPNLVPSDMEIRRNQFTRPLSWKGVWLIKNLFELKNAVRVLADGNVFENTWQAAQDGTAIVMKSVNQQGGCSWCGTTDVTFRNNIVRNAGAGFSIASNPDNSYPVVHLARVSVQNNIVYNINVPNYEGTGRGVLTQGDIADVVISHNTLIQPTNTAFAMGPAGTATVRFVVKDNIMGGGNYGIIGDNVGPGNPTWTLYAPNGTFAGNVLAIGDATNFPSANYYPTSVSSIGFSSLGSFDFHLSASSPYLNKASDGTNPGANVDAVLSATSGVVQP